MDEQQQQTNKQTQTKTNKQRMILILQQRRGLSSQPRLYQYWRAPRLYKLVWFDQRI